ncbi:MAG: type 1 fimbriae regulatory protein FimB [Euryarchaeota archaeon]|nr:type 1 fimbriae regulatory protein FimB [Euryarchaeota archaeon]
MQLPETQLKSPSIVFGTVDMKKHKKRSKPPKRIRNIDRRQREYLTPAEIEQVISVAKNSGRSINGHRDGTMILMAYRHGLRASELVALKWSQMDLKQGLLHVTRRKNGVASTHPLFGPELRALKIIRKTYPDADYVFISERGSPITSAGFRKMVARVGEKTDIKLPLHPHMLRHSTGFKLANDGQDTRSIQHYLGHKNIQHTVRYTEISPLKFKKFFND